MNKVNKDSAIIAIENKYIWTDRSNTKTPKEQVELNLSEALENLIKVLKGNLIISKDEENEKK